MQDVSERALWPRQALLDDLGDRLGSGRGFALATLNLDHLVKLRRNRGFAAAYDRQTHVTADGWPVVWLERLAGRPAERVAGSDLVVPLVQAAARAARPIALVGATDETLDRAAKALVRCAPTAEIALRLAPSQGFDPDGAEADALIATVRRARPGLCLVALGAPKQEILAVRLHAACPGMGIASVGAGLDFLAGTQRRAPGFMRAIGAEWLWRLGGNPRRLSPRYARCAALLPGLALRALARRYARAQVVETVRERVRAPRVLR